MRTIAIINQKGGCGKTTTAINLAGVFSRAGLRTLLIDLDPQSHCAAGLAIPEGRVDISIGDAMLAPDTKSIDWTRLLWRVSRNLDLAPSTVRLAGLESARGGLASHENPERRLLSVLSRLADQYDICLVDCPPSIGLLTYNALVASGEVLIPVETAFFSLQGAGKQVSTIKAIGKRLGVQPPFRLLATMHDPESPLSRDLLEELRRRFEGRVVPTVVRFDQALREAVSFGQPIVEYAPQSMGAEDYIALGRFLAENPPEKPRRVRDNDDLIEVIAGRDDSTAATEPLHPVTAMGPTTPVTVSPNAAEIVLTTPRTATTSVTAPVTAPALEAAPDLTADAVLSRAAELAARANKLATRPSALRLDETIPTLSEVQQSRQTARETAARMESIYGVRPTAGGALFVQPAAIGQRVAIAGEFNAWTPEASPMKLNDRMGVFEACLELPPGQHQYRLVIDGHWTPDPHNPTVAPNPFGEPNSVVVVGPRSAHTAV
ncbi:MAG: AAA family ATPase [Phycisphaerales bacterium]